MIYHQLASTKYLKLIGIKMNKINELYKSALEAKSKGQKLSVDQMMAVMGFSPDDVGPNVSELRSTIAKQLDNGLIWRSAGTWSPECGPAGMKLSPEQRAEAFLEIDKAVAEGRCTTISPEKIDWHDLPPSSGRKSMKVSEWLKMKEQQEEDQHRRIHWI